VFAAFALAVGVAVAAGCGGSRGSSSGANPFQESVDLGLTQYFGTATPSSTVATTPQITTYTYDPASGPVCMTGDPFRFAIRDEGSDDLFIFLQGGGACWSQFCLATTGAPAGIPEKVDILDPNKATNPLRATSTVYLPYCDGSLFVGSTEHVGNADGSHDRIQHGLMNVSAALDVAAQRFPHPKRVILAGSSGGAYGTILATALVRTKWLDVPLLVYEDSGPGIGKPGDVSFIHTLLDEFGALRFVPPSCTDCIGNGHITRLIEWALERDPKLTIASFSSYEDGVIAGIFLDIPGEDYKTALLGETTRIHQEFPNRYRRFLIDGTVHTALLHNPIGIVGNDLTAVILPLSALPKLIHLQLGSLDGTTLDGVSVGEWFGAMLGDGGRWDDLTQ